MAQNGRVRFWKREVCVSLFLVGLMCLLHLLIDVGV